ncbi:MAG TPA: sulfatase [Thermoanaerobaculia bacterium]|nr:sulfatase [Thermoanaerobaculia bacterium]
MYLSLALVIAVAALCAAGDALAVYSDLFAARMGIDFVPLSLVPWSMLVWLAVATPVAAATLLTRVRWPAASPWLVASLPTFLIGVRIIRPLRWSVPSAVVGTALLVSWVGFAFLLRAIVRRVRLAGKGHRIAAVAAAVAVGTVLLASAPRQPVQVPVTRADASRPNVVLIFMDTLRADTAATMPSLQRLAARGASFRAAYAPAPWTLPSHMAVTTGTSPAILGVDAMYQHFGGMRPTLAEILEARGYSTAAVLSNSFLNEGTGFERGYADFRVAHRYLDVCRTTPGLILSRLSPQMTHSVCLWSSDNIIEQATPMLDRLPRPYYLTLNLMDLHAPYWSPCRGSEEAAMFADAVTLHRVSMGRVLQPSERERWRRLYESGAACADRNLARLLDAIERSPDAARTYIIVVADHGEHLGEHGLYMHRNSLYPELLHVPLIMTGPGIPHTVVDRPVSTIWLFSAIVGLTRADPRSSPLMGLIAGVPATLPAVSSVWADQPRAQHVTVIDDRFQYIEDTDSHEELYDMVADPSESHDLSRDPAQQERRAQMRALARPLLSAMAKRPRDSRRDIVRLRSLGYLQ